MLRLVQHSHLSHLALNYALGKHRNPIIEVKYEHNKNTTKCSWEKPCCSCNKPLSCYKGRGVYIRLEYVLIKSLQQLGKS